MAAPEQSPSLPPLPCWATNSRSLPPPTSSHGITTLLLDANAIIQGLNFSRLADQICTVTEVLEEVRDPRARAQIASLPFHIKCIEPEEGAIEKVLQFARATGDIQSLSKTDIKLIALAYTLESQTHGTAHLRSQPSPICYDPSRLHHGKEPLGWGSNLPNPEDWVEFPQEGDEEQPNSTSHILGLKDLNIVDSFKHQCTTTSDGGGTFDGIESFNYSNSPTSFEVHKTALTFEENLSAQDAVFTSTADFSSEMEPCNRGKLEKEDLNYQGKSSSEKLGQRDIPNGRDRNVKKPTAPTPEDNPRRFLGVDASCGELEDVPDTAWEKVTSRSTRRKNTKKALKKAAQESLTRVSQDLNVCASQGVEQPSLDFGDVQASPCTQENTEFFNAHHKHQCLSDSDTHLAPGSGKDGAKYIEGLSENDHIQETSVTGMLTKESKENMSMTNECISREGSLHDEFENEPSCRVAPLWTSSIACLTTDFAMQNVILQMGLRLLSPSGVQVHQLHRWVLKCHGCGNITHHVGRIFCPKCGNGGTLFKVSITVGANGCMQGGRRRRINLRGTRYSLPLPKGGREGASLNPVLREDQLPQKLLYPKVKKVSSTAVLEGLSFSEYASKTAEKKFETLFPVREATAIFSGRKNPNDRRTIRRH